MNRRPTTVEGPPASRSIVTSWLKKGTTACCCRCWWWWSPLRVPCRCCADNQRVSRRRRTGGECRCCRCWSRHHLLARQKDHHRHQQSNNSSSSPQKILSQPVRRRHHSCAHAAYMLCTAVFLLPFLMQAASGASETIPLCGSLSGETPLFFFCVSGIVGSYR